MRVSGEEGQAIGQTGGRRGQCTVEEDRRSVQPTQEQGVPHFLLFSHFIHIKLAHAQLHKRTSITSLMKWNGCVLQGPFDELLGELVDIPPGPAETEPLSAQGWEIGFGHSVYLDKILLYTDENSANLKELSAEISIRPPRGTRTAAATVTYSFKRARCDVFKAITDRVEMERHRKIGSSFEIKVVPRAQNPPAIGPQADRLLFASWFQHLTASPLPFDVRLSFPHSGQDLWANSQILKEVSPYFQDLLENGFTDSNTALCAYPGSTTGTSVKHALDWSDSDDDDPQPTPLKPQQRVHTVKILNHSFKTYQAVYTWIVTSHILFAPLHPLPVTRSGSPSHDDAGSGSTASSTPSPPPAKRLRTDRLDETATPPSGVSPKSVYRLAHFLGLDELQKLALDAFQSGLTVNNVADQLFSSTADSYEEIRTVAVAFAVEHWEEVGESESMRGKIAQVELGELDHGGRISIALAKGSLKKSSEA